MFETFSVFFQKDKIQEPFSERPLNYGLDRISGALGGYGSQPAMAQWILEELKLVGDLKEEREISAELYMRTKDLLKGFLGEGILVEDEKRVISRVLHLALDREDKKLSFEGNVWVKDSSHTKAFK